MQIVIGVCTAGRPKMLAACLRSLAAQSGGDAYVVIVVVDNNAEPGALHIVEEARRASRLPIEYSHEPRRGISYARNRVLEIADRRGAEWIAFIDDDEVAAPDWFSQLLAAAKEYDADIVHGLAIRRYPDRLPLFVLPNQPGRWEEGTEIPYVATNNVLFRGSLAATGAGLRFDSRYAMTAGEDLDFFMRALRRGAKAVHTNRAVVYETVSAERLTLRSQLRHHSAEVAAWYAISRAHEYWPEEGERRPSAGKVAGRLFLGSLRVVTSPLMLIGGLRPFSKAVVRGSWRVAWGWGILCAMRGSLLRPYAVIEGE